MSTENIDALIRSAKDDRALADELRHAGALAKMVQIGAARGYDFTQDELKAYLELPPSEELSAQDSSSLQETHPQALQLPAPAATWSTSSIAVSSRAGVRLETPADALAYRRRVACSFTAGSAAE